MIIVKPHSKRSTIKFTGFLMAGALLGKILGFVREILFAKALGANLVADSFRGAMTAVLLPISPLQGDMIPSTMVPMNKQWSDQNIAPVMFASLFVMFAVISTIIAVVVFTLAPWYIAALCSGFSAEAKAITVQFTQVMSLSMPASVLISLLGCVELSAGRGRLTAIRSSIQNIAIILGIYMMAWTGNPIGIAWGFSVSFNAVALYGYIMLCREGQLDPRNITLSAGFEALAEFFKRAKLLIAQPLFDQASQIVEKLLSSSLITGSMASMDYARTLTDTMMYFISQPIGYVVLSQGEDNVRHRVLMISRPLLNLAIPAALFMHIFAVDIVSIVFQRGEFQNNAIQLTAGAVEGISLGLWASTLGWILIRILNAQRRNATAAKIFVIAYCGNILVNYASYRYYGTFGIGLGEATRGLCLLFGTAYALRCTYLLLRLTALTFPIALLLVIVGLAVRDMDTSALIHLLYGASAFAAITLIWLITMVPETANVFQQLLRKVRKR